jgi:AraC-like DNA-binding protein
VENLYFEQRGKSGFVAPGGVALLNSSEYYEASCPDRFENLTLKAPCASLRSRLPGIDDACASFNHVNPAIAKAILGLASPLLDPDAVMNNHQKDGIAETIVDPLELMLDGEPETTEAPHHSAATLQRVRDIMRNNLADHELTPGTVAKPAGISVRYLHKLYAGSGTTFGKALLAIRLEKANQLTKSDHSHATLQQIAFACGFNSQSHFSTAFKAHFGTSPSLARNTTT